MERQKYWILSLVIVAMSAACGDQSGARVLPEEIDGWADQELLDEFASMGLRINDGDAPPTLSGVFSAEELRVVAHGDPEMVGRRVEPADWAFFEQDEQTISVSAFEYQDEGVLNLNAQPGAISGEGQCFSIFVYDDRRAPGSGDEAEDPQEEEQPEEGEEEPEEEVEDRPCPVTQVFVVSGCMEEEGTGIVDFQVGDRIRRYATEDERCEASTSELRVVEQELVERTAEIDEEGEDGEEIEEE